MKKVDREQRGRNFIGMILFIGMVLILSMSLATTVSADWTKKAAIHIDNTGGGSLSYYQVGLNITYDSDMKTDFSDIRIKNEVTELFMPYWVEDKSNSNWCKLWFNASSIPASSWCNSTYYLYYGDSSASSASNGENTFEFFDAFTSSGTQTETLASSVDPRGPDWGQSVVHHGVNTYHVWGDWTADKNYMSVYNASTDSTTTYEICSWTQTSHSQPTLSMDGNGYFHVFYGAEHTAIQYRKSTNPYDASSWGSADTIYSNSIYPASVAYGNTIFLVLSADGQHTIRFTKSTDGGSNWDSTTVLVNYSSGGQLSNVNQVYRDSTGRIHFTWKERADWGEASTSICYAYTDDQGSTWKRANGTTYSLPITKGNEDYIETGGSSSDSMGSAGNIVRDTSGNLHIPFFRVKDYGTADKYYAKYAKWNGASWSTQTLVDYSNDHGGLNTLHYDTSTETLTIFEGYGYATANRKTIYKHVSTDGGSNWDTTTFMTNFGMLNHLRVDDYGGDEIELIITDYGDGEVLYYHGSAIDGDKWNIHDDGGNVFLNESSYLQISGTDTWDANGITSKKSFDRTSDGYSIEFRYLYDNYPDVMIGYGAEPLNWDSGFSLYHPGSGSSANAMIGNSSIYAYSAPSTNTWYRDAVRAEILNDISFVHNDVTHSNTSSSNNQRIAIQQYRDGRTTYIDWVLVRKYESPDVTYILGSEEDIGGDGGGAYNITLPQGWSIIGWTNLTTSKAQYIANDIGENCLSLVERNRTTGIYNTFNPSIPETHNFDMDRGWGCYVYVSENTLWERDQ